MLYRTLGRTASSLADRHGRRAPQPAALDEAAAVKLIHAALDRGIQLSSIMLGYGHGNSEKWMGTALSQAGYRTRRSLMTSSTVAPAKREVTARRIARSAQDHSYRSRPVHESCASTIRIGILHAGRRDRGARRCKEAGKVRFIGFTGHRIRAYTSTCSRSEARRFAFDTVRCAQRDGRALSQLLAHGGSGRDPAGIASSDEVDGRRRDPEERCAGHAIDCLHYAMNLPTSVVITGIDSDKILDQAFEAAKLQADGGRRRRGARRDDEAIRDRRQVEFFKTSITSLDGETPDWLGEDSRRTEARSAVGS